MTVCSMTLLVLIAWVTGANGQPDATRVDPPVTDPADWPMYNHDLAGWRFNPSEKTLSPTNVGKLAEKWRFPAANSKEMIGVVHATPTVVVGEVYFGTATFPAFFKLAPDTSSRVRSPRLPVSARHHFDGDGCIHWIYDNRRVAWQRRLEVLHF
jgi:glucose dehydrogenase